MPNPLLTVLPASNAPAKPNSESKTPPQHTAVESFELVLEDHVNLQTKDVNVPVAAERVPDSNPTDATEEPDLVDPSVAMAPSLPDEIRQAAKPAQGLGPTDLSSPFPSNAATRPEMTARPDGAPVRTPDTQTLAHHETPATFRSVTSSEVDRSAKNLVEVKQGAATAQAVLSSPERKTSELPIPPETNVAAQHLPKDTSSTRRVSARPEGTALIEQMRLSTKTEARVQTEVAVTSENERIAPFGETSPLSNSRDSTIAAQTFATNARAETARAIAGQMDAAINSRPQTGTIEVALNPEELGRVSIVLNGRDDGLHLTIATERPETLEMMRRHISILEAEFKSLGLGDLSFDLGTPSDAQENASDAEHDSYLETEQNDSQRESIPVPSRMGATGRVDMRL